MLLELTIKNFAIIKDISIQFKQGMTVLTGETGAGKSIIIDALALLAGGRGSSQYIRHGEEKLSLQALFTIDLENEDLRALLTTNGIVVDDDSLIILREIYDSGRSVSRVNGVLVTITMLKAIGQHLVDIQGQDEHQALMQTENHLSFLDDFSKDSLEQPKKNYAKCYYAYTEVLKSRDSLVKDEHENNQRLDMLDFQIKDIESAQLTVGEEESLEKERAQLLNYQTIVTALSKAFNDLQADDKPAGLDLVGQALDALETVADIHPDYKQLSEMTAESFYQLQEVASALSSQMSDLSYDDSRLNEIEARLDTINQLKRRYGQTISDILAYLEQAKNEYQQLNDLDSYVSDLDASLAKTRKEVMQQGKYLSDLRRAMAKQLEKAVQEELKDLYMDKTTFSVHFAKPAEKLTSEDITEKGLDSVSFYIATNPGEPLKPLTKVASGGEMSRMLLALKTIFSKQQGVTSIIFDEVDTGVSGRVAQAIADKIYSIAGDSQVLCITHLPQVAAKADNHIYIEKHTEGNRTKTQAKSLNEKQKLEEIARMMAGEEVSESARQAAKSLRQTDKD